MLDIIIPAYNAHKTIMSCLFSILNQTVVRTICVYLIDDCSDTSYKEEYDFFKNKLKIKLIRLDKNSGPGVSRQIGIDNSKSKYMMFLDSDDVLYDSFAIENILNIVKKKECDVVLSNMIEKYNGELRIYNSGFDTLHSKIYKRDFIIKHNIEFSTSYNSEDLAFNNLVLMNNPTIEYCENLVYGYRRRENSLTMTEDYYEKKHIRYYSENLIWSIRHAESNNTNPRGIANIISFSFAYLYYYFTIKTSMKDKSISHIFGLVPYYEKYRKYISKKNQYKNIEYWFSLRDKKQFEISFNEFYNYCKQNYEKVL